jgi:glycosyltransferase involved in cell wall biosynthesis
MDVFAMSSAFEGLPLALLEAMAMDCPVVATRVGGIPEVVVDRKTGLLVDPHDPGALAASIGELLGSPALAAQLAEAGRQAVELQYGIPNCVRQHEAVYAQLVNGTARRN